MGSQDEGFQVGPTGDRSYYKFLSEEHLAAFMSGAIRMGGFDTYSLLEIITGDRWIGDREESRAITRLDRLSTRQIFVKNSSFVSMSYGYCFSLSVGNFERLRDAMINSLSPYKYDACIEILNMPQFLRRLGLALEKTFPNFREMGFEAKTVTYSDAGNQHDAKHWNDYNSHNPFSKPTIYSDQKEFRVAVTMDRDDQKYNYLKVEAGDISDIARPIKLPSMPVVWSNPFRLNEVEAKQSIRDSLAIMESYGGEAHPGRDSAIDDLVYAYGCLRFGPGNYRSRELDFSIIMYDDERRIPHQERVSPFLFHGENIAMYMRRHAADFA